jgi:hypothetical protein
MRYVMVMGMLATLLGGIGTVWAAEPLPRPQGPVLLTISGKIRQTNADGTAQFDRQMLEALGQTSLKTSSALSDKPQVFEGVPLRAVLDRVGAEGSSLVASALNNYKASIPWNDLNYDPLLAMRVDGQVLRVRDKGPLWIVYPRDARVEVQTQEHDSRWVWQLNKLQVE